MIQPNASRTQFQEIIIDYIMILVAVLLKISWNPF